MLLANLQDARILSISYGVLIGIIRLSVGSRHQKPIRLHGRRRRVPIYLVSRKSLSPEEFSPRFCPRQAEVVLMILIATTPIAVPALASLRRIAPADVAGMPNGFFISSARFPLPDASGPGRTILFFTPTLLSLVDKY
jgi:hypothetical protein